MTAREVLDLVAEGRIERVPPNKAQAGRMLQACTKHIESADVRAGADPSGAYALVYDAIRKAVAAHMLFHGFRTTSRPGSHAATVTYAEAELGKVVAAQHVSHLDRMRRTRHASEYEERPVTEQEVRTDLAHAAAIVQAIVRALFPPKTAKQAPKR
jgi:hypothetical protein